MLTFLRNIRKSLIDSGSARKYLIYAVGEILLVMIGILLALQINNWNEREKLRNVEIKLIEELISTAQEDISSNQHMLMRNKETYASIKILISHIDQKLPYHDSLSQHFQMAHNRWVFLLSNHAFQNAEDAGLNFLPDSTKAQLVNLYEYAQNYLNILEERNNLYNYNIVVPYLTSHFRITYPQGIKLGGMEPINYSELVNDQEYITILRSLSAYKLQYLSWQEYTMLNNLHLMVHLLSQELE